VYDHYLALIAGKKELPSQPLSDTAGIIRRFIEEYHEKQEEDFVFPRFEKAHKRTELVATLRAQHKAGRQVTAQVLRLASATALKQPADRERLAQGLRAFLRMYRPHEAREDTVLFPALHEIVSKHEYDAMGEDFEKREHQMFGEAGFEGMVEKIGAIEKQIGINELAQFTPRP
jgi:hemerythrin-like domain-containing protein